MIRTYILLILILLLSTISVIAFGAEIKSVRASAERLESAVSSLKALADQPKAQWAPLERNPMSPEAAKAKTAKAAQPAAQSLRVEGILSSAGEVLALVNGAVHRVGDTIGEYTIKEIREDEIHVEKAGRIRSVRLFSLEQ